MKELNEVSPRRLAEYKVIRAKVDAKAKRCTLEEIGTLGLRLMSLVLETQETNLA